MLVIKKEVYEEMLEHCINSFPYEACGLLAGKDKATEIYKIKNIERSSVSYFMEPLEQLRAMKDIRKKEIDMLAIYHSHPFGNAEPSMKDIELALYDVYYVIIAINQNNSFNSSTDNSNKFISNKPFQDIIFLSKIPLRLSSPVKREITVKCFKIKESVSEEVDFAIL